MGAHVKGYTIHSDVVSLCLMLQIFIAIVNMRSKYIECEEFKHSLSLSFSFSLYMSKSILMEIIKSSIMSKSVAEVGFKIRDMSLS